VSDCVGSSAESLVRIWLEAFDNSGAADFKNRIDKLSI
jgi:hypothetical protein